MHLSANAQRQQTLLCREVEILRTLPPHPNIVRLVDAFEVGNWFLMVLERVSGGDLFTVLTARQTQRFLDEEVVHVTRQIAEGLAFLHRQGVIHRDLKLENVLVASERREQPFVWYDVKITDFGLSKDVSVGMSTAHSLVGTRPYTAPEVELKNSYGVSSDVWCLGILVFIMLTGRFPFDRIPSQQGALDCLVDEVECSEALKALASGLLQLDPGSRLSLSRMCSEGWLDDGLDGLCSARERKRQRVDVQCAPAPAPAPEQATAAQAQAQGAPEEPCAAAPSAGSVAHHHIRTDKRRQEGALAHLLDALDFDQAIVFANSARQAAGLEGLLSAEGFSSILVHSDLDAAVRAERCQQFLDFEKRVLVSTDLPEGCTAAARVDLVINFDAPATPEQYLGRMGRGRRFLTAGCMVTFVREDSEAVVLEEVEKRTQANFTAMLAKVSLDSE
mmetsp:Transcript_1798/g.3664  ORF Transcript_1798/g.3664 Transcript_1798/m.3664 type:complete len:447 (-) Transcript_1798:104-1444(-)